MVKKVPVKFAIDDVVSAVQTPETAQKIIQALNAKFEAKRKAQRALRKKSKYVCVNFDVTTGKWFGRVWHKKVKKHMYCGHFNNEFDCAIAVNQKCLELNIPLKNYLGESISAFEVSL